MAEQERIVAKLEEVLPLCEGLSTAKGGGKMTMKDMERTIKMLCPVCGNDQFESLDDKFPELNEAPDEVKIRCADCGGEYTKEELIRENSEKISVAIDDFTSDIVKEVEKDLAKALKKWR